MNIPEHPTALLNSLSLEDARTIQKLPDLLKATATQFLIEEETNITQVLENLSRVREESEKRKQNYLRQLTTTYEALFKLVEVHAHDATVMYFEIAQDDILNECRNLESWSPRNPGHVYAIRLIQDELQLKGWRLTIRMNVPGTSSFEGARRQGPPVIISCDFSVLSK